MSVNQFGRRLPDFELPSPDPHLFRIRLGNDYPIGSVSDSFGNVSVANGTGGPE